MRARAFRLFWLILPLWALPAPADDPRLLGAVVLRTGQAGFGGLSAVEIADDGSELILLSDRGTLFRGTAARDAGGRFASLTLIAADRLIGPDGAVPARGDRDSEGLALAPQGRLFLSFEGRHRVAEYRGGGRSTDLPGHAEFAAMPPNGSLEALAIDPDGRLLAFPEDGARDAAIPVYRRDAGGWSRPYSLPRRGDFKPVGADFDHAGRLLLLERDFSPFFGFATRIRRFELGPDGPISEQVLLTTEHGDHGNLEGIGLWRDGAGRTVATLVADDNFNAFLVSELVEYLLPD